MSITSSKGDNQLIDEFGRKISYLRVSLTRQCNFRCIYCYGSLENPPRDSGMLTDGQYIRLIRVFAELGVRKIRFTGGEPLVRPGILDIIKETASTDGISLIGITTNGFMLKSMLPALLDSGLNRLNVSLDTLNKEKFVRIAGIKGYDRVLGGIMSAIECGRFPIVKVNTVVIRGVNDDEIASMARWALSQPIDLRFIEFMPTSDSGWGPDRFVPESEIKDRIGMPLIPLGNKDASRGTSKTFSVSGKPGRVSFISAVSHNFCAECNRVRLTADGEVYGCLFGANGVNIRELLIKHKNDSELLSQIKSLVLSPGFRRHPAPITIAEPQPCMRRMGG